MPLAPPRPADKIRIADGRATAPFLAHLIATTQGAPQTRERRRADPDWASTTYSAAMEIPEGVGRILHAVR